MKRTKDTPAVRRLAAKLADLNLAGEFTPCAWLGAAGPWISEDPEQRAVAIPLCRLCPVLSECHEAATEAKERFGVWAGRDRTINTTSNVKEGTER